MASKECTVEDIIANLGQLSAETSQDFKKLHLQQVAWLESSFSQIEETWLPAGALQRFRQADSTLPTRAIKDEEDATVVAFAKPTPAVVPEVETEADLKPDAVPESAPAVVVAAAAPEPAPKAAPTLESAAAQNVEDVEEESDQGVDAPPVCCGKTFASQANLVRHHKANKNCPVFKASKKKLMMEDKPERATPNDAHIEDKEETAEQKPATRTRRPRRVKAVAIEEKVVEKVAAADEVVVVEDAAVVEEPVVAEEAAAETLEEDSLVLTADASTDDVILNVQHDVKQSTKLVEALEKDEELPLIEKDIEHETETPAPTQTRRKRKAEPEAKRTTRAGRRTRAAVVEEEEEQAEEKQAELEIEEVEIEESGEEEAQGEVEAAEEVEAAAEASDEEVEEVEEVKPTRARRTRAAAAAAAPARTRGAKVAGDATTKSRRGRLAKKAKEAEVVADVEQEEEEVTEQEAESVETEAKQSPVTKKGKAVKARTKRGVQKVEKSSEIEEAEFEEPLLQTSKPSSLSSLTYLSVSASSLADLEQTSAEEKVEHAPEVQEKEAWAQTEAAVDEPIAEEPVEADVAEEENMQAIETVTRVSAEAVKPKASARKIPAAAAPTPEADFTTIDPTPAKSPPISTAPIPTKSPALTTAPAIPSVAITAAEPTAISAPAMTIAARLAHARPSLPAASRVKNTHKLASSEDFSTLSPPSSSSPPAVVVTEQSSEESKTSNSHLDKLRALSLKTTPSVTPPYSQTSDALLKPSTRVKPITTSSSYSSSTSSSSSSSSTAASTSSFSSSTAVPTLPRKSKQPIKLAEMAFAQLSDDDDDEDDDDFTVHEAVVPTKTEYAPTETEETPAATLVDKSPRESILAQAKTTASRTSSIGDSEGALDVPRLDRKQKVDKMAEMRKRYQESVRLQQRKLAEIEALKAGEVEPAADTDGGDVLSVSPTDTPSELDTSLPDQHDVQNGAQMPEITTHVLPPPEPTLAPAASAQAYFALPSSSTLETSPTAKSMSLAPASSHNLPNEASESAYETASEFVDELSAKRNSDPTGPIASSSSSSTVEHKVEAKFGDTDLKDSTMDDIQISKIQQPELTNSKTQQPAKKRSFEVALESSSRVDDEAEGGNADEKEENPKASKLHKSTATPADLGAKKVVQAGSKPGEGKNIAERRAEAAERKRKMLDDEELKRKKARTEDRQVRAEAFEKRKLETQQERSKEKELKRKQAKDKVQALAVKAAPVAKKANTEASKKPGLKKVLAKPKAAPVSSLASVPAPAASTLRPALKALKTIGADTNVMSPPADRPPKSGKGTPSPANPFQSRKAVSPEQTHNADNYEMSDNNEESDWSDSSTPRKPIPKWSTGSALQEAIAFSEHTDPDSVFPPMEGTLCNLTEIFKGFKSKKRFKTRTSSGNWFPDRLQWKEEQAYKTDMGYAR